MSRVINLFLKGIFVGIANIIPGVSGGTIAVVLRIFDQLIDAVNNFFKNPKGHIKFLIPLGVGVVTGIGIFSKIIEFLLQKFSFPTTMFFVGLVIGSVPLIYSQAKKQAVKPKYYLVSFLTFILVILISLISVRETESIIDVSFQGLMKLFFTGIIASSAMVIPGISGSFVMVLLGVYNSIIVSTSEFLNILVKAFSLISTEGVIFSLKYILTSGSFISLATFGVGVIIGVIIISKIIAILLKKAFSLTYFAILGFIFGSIFSIFSDPITYQSYASSIPVISIVISVFTFILGFIISFKLGE